MRYVLRRLALALVQMFVLAVLVFALTALLPGDAADVRLAEHAASDVTALRASLGLDEPVVSRFMSWLGGVFAGDLGTSLVSGRPVVAVISGSVGTTLVLTVAVLVVVIPLALVLGVVAGVRGGRVDRVITVGAVGLSAVPDFVVAVVLVAVFSLWLGWLPATWVGGSFSLALLVLPVLVLLGRSVCLLSRQVRAGVMAAVDAPYVAQARRFGVGPVSLLVRHVLPNAAVPAVQELARTGDALLGGVLVVEALFAIPGLATELVSAVRLRDVPVVQGITLFLAVAALLINLAADLVCDRLVPRRQVAR